MFLFRLFRRAPAPPPSDDQILAAAAMAERAVAWFDIEGRLISANAVFARLMGHDPADLPGMEHRAFCEPAFADSLAYGEIWRMLRAGETVSRTVPRVTAHGAHIWLDAVYVPVRGADGAVARVLSLASDVTAIRQAQDEAEGMVAAMRRSRAMAEWSAEGRLISANDQFLRTLGYAQADLAGKDHRLLVTEDEAGSPDYAGFWPRLAQGEDVSGIYRRRTASGDIVYLGTTYAPVLDRAGKVAKVLEFARDQTAERRHIADMTGQIEALQRSMAVIAFDLDGHVTEANDKFLNLFGYGADQVVGQHHRMFVSPEERNSPAYAAFWRDLAAGHHCEGEFRRVDHQGRPVWIIGSYYPILDEAGRPVRVVKFARDVTERKTAVNELIAGLAKLAEGILTARIHVPLGGEFAQIRLDFNRSLEGMTEVMTRVIQSGHQVMAEVGAITASADELSRRTERQAAALEETAAAMEELTASVRKASEAAAAVRGDVQQSNLLAQSGGEIVGRTVAAMSEIAESSGKISKIITVIDEIAFQTNLLALNAGVEAARAGESGRGFAVVASEVRALAQRSSSAASEIAELIALSSRQVKTGVDLVGETGESLTRICASVGDMLDRVERIARLSDEQTAAISEINAAVSDLDRTTQANAAMFEEVTAATRTLNGTAQGLVDSTDAFTLTTGDETAQAGELELLVPAGRIRRS